MINPNIVTKDELIREIEAKIMERDELLKKVELLERLASGINLHNWNLSHKFQMLLAYVKSLAIYPDDESVKQAKEWFDAY